MALPNLCAPDSNVDDFALTPAERALFCALAQRGVQGAPLATQDIDIWLERPDDPRLPLAALDAHGLDTFDAEYISAFETDVEGVSLHILPLARVIASKRATGRPKNRAALPALEAALLARGAADKEK